MGSAGKFLASMLPSLLPERESDRALDLLDCFSLDTDLCRSNTVGQMDVGGRM